MDTGDRILVRNRQGRDAQAGEFVEDRGSKCRVLLDGEHVTRIVSKERVTAVRVKALAPTVMQIANEMVAAGSMDAEEYIEALSTRSIPMRPVPPDDHATHARLHAEMFPDSPALRSIFSDSPTALRAVPKAPKPMRDAAYLAFVREHDCCARDGVFTSCEGPIEAHHFGPRGMGQKADDWYAVSLCQRCHRYFHDHGLLPSMNRSDTEDHFAAAQRELLLEWLGCAKDKEIVDAIVGVLRKEREER